MTLPGRQERQLRWAGLAWALWVLTLLGLAATAWLDALLRQAGQPALAWLGAGNAASAGAAVVAATVGALVASRRPRHPVGWLLVAMGLSVSLSAAGSSYKWYGLGAQPGSLPAASYLAGLTNGLNIVYVACAGFVLLLTPTGTLPSRRWRWWPGRRRPRPGCSWSRRPSPFGRCTRSTRTSSARSASRPWTSRRWTWSSPSPAWSSWWRW